MVHLITPSLSRIKQQNGRITDERRKDFEGSGRDLSRTTKSLSQDSCRLERDSNRVLQEQMSRALLMHQLYCNNYKVSYTHVNANKAEVMERIVIPLGQTLLLVEGTGLATKAVYIGHACICS